MNPNEIIGIICALLAALTFGSYGVPMKGETASRLNIDPLVFQSYKAFTVFVTSTILILLNNLLADEFGGNEGHVDSVALSFTKWTLHDFTPWALVSASLWVPGGTAGVYAIRRAGLAISVGIWSSVIVILSFVWGILIFDEKRNNGTRGSLRAMVLLCFGLSGIAYFSSFEAENKRKKQSRGHRVHGVISEASETTSLQQHRETMNMDVETSPHSCSPPHSHQSIDLNQSSMCCFRINKRFPIIPEYHLGLLMAVLNGVLAATILVPLHYAPPNSTNGVGFSMSFGVSSVLVVLVIWVIRWFINSTMFLYTDFWSDDGIGSNTLVWKSFFVKGYSCLPPFHFKEMWQPGLLSGLLYSMGNMFGIMSVQRLGNFMGYSLNQTSVIVSGFWGIFYYQEITGVLNIIGFLLSSFVTILGILLMSC